jgi:hypothetical protein
MHQADAAQSPISDGSHHWDTGEGLSFTGHAPGTGMLELTMSVTSGTSGSRSSSEVSIIVGYSSDWEGPLSCSTRGIGEDGGVDRNGELETGSEQGDGTGELDRAGEGERVTMVGGNEGRSMVSISEKDERRSKAAGEGVRRRVEGMSKVGVSGAGEGLSTVGESTGMSKASRVRKRGEGMSERTKGMKGRRRRLERTMR